MRRECQMIIPGLWLGPYTVSKDMEFLKQLKITHMHVSLTRSLQ